MSKSKKKDAKPKTKKSSHTRKTKTSKGKQKKKEKTPETGNSVDDGNEAPESASNQPAKLNSPEPPKLIDNPDSEDIPNIESSEVRGPQVGPSSESKPANQSEPGEPESKRKSPNWLQEAAFFLGLDCLCYLWSAPDPTVPEAGLSEEKIAAWKKLDEEKLEQAFDFVSSRNDAVNARLATVESKANTLVGATGVIMGLMTGFARPLLSTAPTNGWSYILLGLFLLGISAALVSLLLGRRVTAVGGWFTQRLKLDVLSELEEASLTETKVRRIATVVNCYTVNDAVATDKCEFLIASQIWFRNSVVALFALAFLAAAFTLTLPGNSGSKPGGTTPPMVSPRHELAPSLPTVRETGEVRTPGQVRSGEAVTGESIPVSPSPSSTGGPSATR